MEFDESKVYTLVNADKVRAGSRGYFADNLRDLKYIVEHDCSEEYGEITEIKNNSYATRFKIENYLFMLFYLVEEPVEKNYRPYYNTSEMPSDTLLKEVVDKYDVHSVIVAVDKEQIYIGARGWANMKYLYDNFRWSNGMPCGIKEK